MIYGNIASPQQTKSLPKVIQRALEYLASTDFDALDFGTYEPTKEFSVQVIDFVTKEPEAQRPELHREKLDIHFSITGEETVYCRVVPTGQPLAEDLLDEKDIGFYENVDQELAIPLAPGDFVVFFPGEIHRPGCKKESVSAIKKVVVKIDGKKVFPA